MFWLIVNGVIAPFSVLFAILPGPNLIGYWFAYRAIHHMLVVWGIRRVRRNKIPTELHPIAALDLPIERDGDGKMGHAALTGAATRLAEHVTWHDSSRGARADKHSLRETTTLASQTPPISRLRSPEMGDHAPTELQHS